MGAGENMSDHTYKPILCLDFDGVIHSYTSGWGDGAKVVADPPVPNAMRFIVEATEVFEVNVYSSRSGQLGGIYAMQKWMVRHMMSELHMGAGNAECFVTEIVQWPLKKPPAMVGLDDRVKQFTGVWPDLDELRQFKPWNKE